MCHDKFMPNAITSTLTNDSNWVVNLIVKPKPYLHQQLNFFKNSEVHAKHQEPHYWAHWFLDNNVPRDHTIPMQ